MRLDTRTIYVAPPQTMDEINLRIQRSAFRRRLIRLSLGAVLFWLAASAWITWVKF